MQFKSFKLYIGKVINEGNRLQKYNIDGSQTTKRKITTLQVAALIIAIGGLFLLKRGFSENFAGFVIGFLGIFIGLFTSIVISSFDKSKLDLNLENKEITQVEKVRIIKIKNHLVQFTGLTSYSILLAVFIIILLSLVLLHPVFNTNIFEYRFVNRQKLTSFMPWIKGLKVAFLVGHRFFVIYLLINFFTVTIYSITGYFTYLQSEYRRMKIK